MNEQEKTVEEAAVAKYPYEQTDRLFIRDLQSVQQKAFIGGVIWQQSDPTFIGDIVRQTLLEVVNTGLHSPAMQQGILNMHPEIVNNIIKKK